MVFYLLKSTIDGAEGSVDIYFKNKTSIRFSFRREEGKIRVKER